MRVKTSKSSKGSISYSIIKDVTIDGKRTTKIVESLGNAETIRKQHPDMEPLEYAKQRAKELTEQQKQGKVKVVSKFNKKKIVEKNKQPLKEVGPLFIDTIYYQLKLDKLCQRISKHYKFQFDLSEILKTLISTRVLFPNSKLSSYKQAQSFIVQPDFKLHDVYRALEVLAEHSQDIQQFAYDKSKQLVQRNDQILYYDCTNFFFEIEEASDKKQYGVSKEHRPNPIIQMGLFLDGSGIPLAFSTFAGNKNEQPSLKPLEIQIMKDFGLSQFVVCTDAGLSSQANRRFNNFGKRAFVTTQSIKKLKKELKEWCLNPSDWYYSGSNGPVNLNDIDLQEHADTVFYKERWIRHDQTKAEKQGNIRPLEEKLVVTFIPKYKFYQQEIREKQINRAISKIDNPSSLKKKNPNDPTRFVKTKSITADGEVADKTHYFLDEEAIQKEAQYDGFYAVCTNLEAAPEDIVKINKGRWEIEESFRILKSEFKSRPVYLQREDRIDAHFLTCFLALLVYRILEKEIDDQYTCSQIIDKLREIKWVELPGEGYVPAYERNELTDKLHETVGFRTDNELIDKQMFKKILRKVKSGR